MSLSRIDESKAFVPVGIAVMTVSDTRTEADDKSGGSLVQMLEEAGHTLVDRAIIRDEAPEIQARVSQWLADPKVDVVITTGGTGFTGRDVTPEAVSALFDKEMEGFAALFHMISYEKVGTSTIQSRACAGLAQGTYVFCLPGSPGACKDAWNGILKHQLDIRHRPCNLVEIMPRLSE